MEDNVQIRVVYYENGKTPRTSRTFPDRAALERFFDEQERAMTHAGFEVIRGRDFINLYPPSDSLSDGSFSTWTVVD